jgi:hypothetical protein
MAGKLMRRRKGMSGSDKVRIVRSLKKGRGTCEVS